jgi:hypothetical protein
MLLLLSLVGLSKTFPSLRSSVDKVTASLPNVMAMLAERSPGTRTTAELTKLKKRRVVTASAKPKERALGKIFQPEHPALYKALTPNNEMALSPLLGFFPPTTAIATAGIPGLLTPVPGVPPVVIAASPAAVGGGGGGGGVTPVPPTQVPTVTPAVPEPGTWATMLLGFALMGGALRFRRRSESALKLR